MPHPNSSSEEEYEGVWLERRDFRTPDAKKSHGEDLAILEDRISLKGRTLQAIVKLANIILTPAKPRYRGGKWNVEGSYKHPSAWTSLLKFSFQGIRHEKIISSFIYVSSSLEHEIPASNTTPVL